MDPNPYESPQTPPAKSADLFTSRVSWIEWGAVIVIGVFTVACIAMCWYWLQDFPH